MTGFLFNDDGEPIVARARRNDPATSHAAAVTVEKSGTASGQRLECLNAVVANPGKTAAEIARIIGADRHMPSRRLPELRAAGLVANGGRRVCSVQGTGAMTWEAT